MTTASTFISSLLKIGGHCNTAAYAGLSVCGKLLRAMFYLVVILYFVFCIVFLGLRYLVLPNVGLYKGELEHAASQAIGRPLHIGHVQTAWQGLNPHLVLEQVVISDKNGQPALTLPTVKATVSWWTAVFMQLRFSSIDISAPRLEAMRSADGKLLIAGFPLESTQSGNDAGMDWLLSQRRIAIHSGTLVWTDLQRQAPVLQLSDINVVLTNQWRSHKFAIQATPPATLAAPLDIRGDFTHPAFSRRTADFANWRGDLYVDLQRTDLPSLKHYVDYPADLQTGFGSIRSWTRLDHGRVEDFTADIRIRDVIGRFGTDLPVLDLTRVSGRLIASESKRRSTDNWFGLLGESGHSIALNNFSMQTRDGLQLPPTTIKESFVAATKDHPEKVALYAESLDLQMLANFAGHLPIPADQRKMLGDFAPKGQLKNFSANWQGSYPDIASYSLKGQFINLSMQAQAAQLERERNGNEAAKAAVPAIPGFDNLSGTVSASDKGGNFSLDSSNLVLQLPSYFIDPVMPFKRLQMQASWLFEKDDKLNFQISKMEFQQDGMSGSLSGRHVMSMRPGADKGSLDFSGKLTGFDLKQLDRFVPEGTPQDLRYWLTHGIQDGRADNVSVRIKGDVKDFPFQLNDNKANRRAEFVVRGSINGGKLDFAPGMLADDGKSPLWPVIEDIKGSFIFDRNSMEIRAESGKSMGLDFMKVKAVIPDLLSTQPQLAIDGNVSGGLQTMFQYVNASPVNGFIAHFLQNGKANGQAKVALKLGLPLAALLESKVSGTLQFAGNDVLLDAMYPALHGTTGKLDFFEYGFALNGVKTNVLGGASTVTGGMQKDGVIRIRSEGGVTADGLMKEYAGTPIDKLLGHVDGATRYSLNINVKNGLPQIMLDSNLQGLALNLPEPVYKSANDIIPLHVEVNPQSLPEQALQSDEIKITAGSLLSAHYRRQKNPDEDWRVVSGGIGINARAPEPEAEVAANVEAHHLNVDTWKTLLTELNGGNSKSGNVNVSNTKTSQDLGQYVAIGSVALHVNELQIFGKKLDGVTLGMSSHQGQWQANVDSAQVSGHFSWQPPGPGAGQLSAKLTRLIIPQTAANDVGDLLEGKNIDTEMPGVDINADEFELFGKKLGSITLQANNHTVSGGREWKIDNLNISNPDAELKASGKWSNQGADAGTALKYTLEIHDAGKLLERLGFAEIMKKGNGKLEGDVKWNGLPFSLDTASLSGQVQLEMHSGQFLKVEQGAAKLLGVLSLQSIPRRLTLDFRDIFSEGFAFDAINSSAQIQNGLAKTTDFKMKSLNATILIDGSADIAKESQNLHVIVLPEINASGASVLYGLAVNPVVGLGTLLAQLFLRDPLTRAFTYEYHITGPWSDPNVVKVDLHSPIVDHQQPPTKLD